MYNQFQYILSFFDEWSRQINTQAFLNIFSIDLEFIKQFIISYNIIMNIDQEQQQLTFKYLFIITPFEIKSTSKLKNNNKSILIKLGNQIAKCSKLNTPLELQIDVLYSKTLQKYCPIKGIIKIYDVAENGSEIISCVGGFQTDQLLNEGKTNVVIQKQIGTSKLKMEVKIVNKSQRNQKKNDKLNLANYSPLSKELSYSKQRYLLRKNQADKNNISLNQTHFDRPLAAGSQILQARIAGRKNSTYLPSGQSATIENIQIPYKNTSSNVNKSIQQINQTLNYKKNEINTTKKTNQFIMKTQVDTLKEKLSEQKRKCQIFQEKFSQSNQRLYAFRSSAVLFQNELKSNAQMFRKLIQTLDLVQGKQLIYEIDEKKQTLNLKYKNKQIQKQFKNIFDYYVKRLAQPIQTLQLQCDYFDRSIIECEQLKKQMVILKKLMMQKDKKNYSQQKQIQGIETIIHNLKQTNKHINKQNNYLRQKNNQVQLSLYHKENQIQSFKKQIDKKTYDLQEIETKLYNQQLQMEELKEEVSNCNETIQKYRLKYGELKGIKNRTIQMEIKDCLRWIDQQNRDPDLSQIEDTMQTELKQEKEDSLSSNNYKIDIEKDLSKQK